MDNMIYTHAGKETLIFGNSRQECLQKYCNSVLKDLKIYRIMRMAEYKDKDTNEYIRHKRDYYYDTSLELCKYQYEQELKSQKYLQENSKNNEINVFEGEIAFDILKSWFITTPDDAKDTENAMYYYWEVLLYDENALCFRKLEIENAHLFDFDSDKQCGVGIKVKQSRIS